MTIICALHDPKENCTWIGSDTLIKDGGFLCPEIVPKWVRHNGWALGWTGHLRTLNVMEHYKEEILDLEQMFLIANPHGVWDVGSDFAFKRANAGTLSAVGSGCDYAFGVAHALEPYDKHPKEIVATALEAAIRYEADCGNDVWIECLKN